MKRIYVKETDVVNMRSHPVAQKGDQQHWDTHTNDSAGVEDLAPGLHDKSVVYGDDEDLAGVLEVRMGKIAGDVLLRASWAWREMVNKLFCVQARRSRTY